MRNESRNNSGLTIEHRGSQLILLGLVVILDIISSSATDYFLAFAI